MAKQTWDLKPEVELIPPSGCVLNSGPKFPSPGEM